MVHPNDEYKNPIPDELEKFPEAPCIREASTQRFHFVLWTVLCTVYCALCTAYCVLCTVYFALGIVYCALLCTVM
jgi:hypothetical protein